VASPGFTPTGAVTVGRYPRVTGIAGCNLTPVSAGVSSCSVSSVAEPKSKKAMPPQGTEHLIAAYPGDDAVYPIRAQASLLLYKPPPPPRSGTRLSCGSPLVVGLSTTCTAVVTSSAGVTGTVTFSDNSIGGNFQPDSCQLGGSGTSASCTVTYTPGSPGQTGHHSVWVVAQFAGQDGLLNSSHRTLLPVVRLKPEVGFSCPTEEIVEGGEVTCTVVVSTSKVAPTGSVTFSHGDGGCTLIPEDAETSSCSVLVGTPSFRHGQQHEVNINAHYEGDDAVLPGAATTRISVLRYTDTTTSLTCQASTLLIGDSTICTVTVSISVLGPAPEGPVEFLPQTVRNNFAPPVCDLVDNGNGTASCSTTYTPTAWNAQLVDRTLTARYPREGPYLGSHARFVIATARPG
jgi:hypothetical protein